MSELFIADRRKNRDRRVAVRTPADGAVEISFDFPVPTVIAAELVETSETGFRAVHDSKALEAGLEVCYQRPDAAGRARVIWTHVLNGRRVSGFMVLVATQEPAA
ncbi:MAG: hypothetical protein WBY44_03050 [Bryobacteraceae bacterium]